MKHRDTKSVHRDSQRHYERAIREGLMQVTMHGRDGKTVTLPDGRKVVEFVNCSYLGLDVHPAVVKAYQSVDPTWGVNFCAARSRFSIAPLTALEEQLSARFHGRAVTFPTVTATHMSVMPLLASGVLFSDTKTPVRFVFDRFAHSSMQYLKPILAQEATVTTIPHNSFEMLRAQVLDARVAGQRVVYVADGIYSMGGLCPVKELLALADELDFHLYLDDAHGTTLFGERGEGFVLSEISGDIPDRLFVTFSLTKGFGAAGGGILVSNATREQLIRNFGQVYAFSAPIDFASVNACLAVLKLHADGTVARLQARLRENVALFDNWMGNEQAFSPIRMIDVGDEERAISIAKELCDSGFFVSVAFFPIVPRGRAQLRVCLAANHRPSEICALAEALRRIFEAPSVSLPKGRIVPPVTFPVPKVGSYEPLHW